jgi:methylmalonyl-CoA epimerase
MKLDHIGIAVRSLDNSLKFYRDTMGLQIKGVEEVEAEKVRVAMLPLGETRIELLEATAQDSTIARFIEKRGEGVHHIAVVVADLDAYLKRLEASGVTVLPGKGKYGASGHRYAFLHPASCGGVLIELVESLESGGKKLE